MPPSSSPSPSPLERVPLEVLEHIFLHSLHLPLGPPIQLPALLTLSSDIHAKLADNPAFLHRLFALSFDLNAPRRRFARSHITSLSIRDELKLRWRLLARIRNCQAFPYHDLEHDLWKIYLMLLESDGRNEAQLFLYADLPRFARLWAAHHLPEIHDDYPPESPAISLGLYILWRVRDPATVRQDALAYNYGLMQSLSPFNIAVFKYAAAYVPEVHYDLPVKAGVSVPPDSLSAAHHSYPVYRPAVNYKACDIANPPPGTLTQTVSHFGLDLRLAPPLASQFSLLIFFTYHEVRGIQPSPSTPATRTERDHLGIQQASREDLDDHNHHAGTRFVLPPPQDGLSDGSRRFEQDFYRAWGCGSPTDLMYGSASFYKLGSLNGLWEGRMLYPEIGSYQALLARPDLPETFRDFFLFTSPAKVRIREYYCPTTSELLPYPEKDPGDGLRNAWFPLRSKFKYDQSLFVIEDDGKQYQYEFCDPNVPLYHEEDDCEYCDEEEDDPELKQNYSYPGAFRPISNDCPKYLDVIIVGETDPDHAKAWGNFRFYGRIRRFDGLIVMVRESMNPGHGGRWIFRGYLTSDQNFVGRWRDGATDPRHPGAMEGSFTLNKRQSNS